MWLRSFLSLGKGKREMTQKLYKKEFPKDMIEEKIALLDEEIVDWETHKNQIEHQIRTLLERGKSLRSIAILMISRYPYFRDEITEYMESSEDTD
jgi:SOS response regulatory protein OraA/RecX